MTTLLFPAARHSRVEKSSVDECAQPEDPTTEQAAADGHPGGTL